MKLNLTNNKKLFSSMTILFFITSCSGSNSAPASSNSSIPSNAYFVPSFDNYSFSMFTFDKSGNLVQAVNSPVATGYGPIAVTGDYSQGILHVLSYKTPSISTYQYTTGGFKQIATIDTASDAPSTITMDSTLGCVYTGDNNENKIGIYTRLTTGVLALKGNFSLTQSTAKDSNVLASKVKPILFAGVCDSSGMGAVYNLSIGSNCGLSEISKAPENGDIMKIGLSKDEDTLFVLTINPSTLLSYAIGSDGQLRLKSSLDISSKTSNPLSFAIADDIGKIFIADSIDNDIIVIDSINGILSLPQTNNIFPVGHSPSGIVFTQENKVIVSNYIDNSIITYSLSPNVIFDNQKTVAGVSTPIGIFH